MYLRLHNRFLNSYFPFHLSFFPSPLPPSSFLVAHSQLVSGVHLQFLSLAVLLDSAFLLFPVLRLRIVRLGGSGELVGRLPGVLRPGQRRWR